MEGQQPIQLKEASQPQQDEDVNERENENENVGDEDADEAMKAAMGFTAFTSSTSKNYYSKQKARVGTSSARGFSGANATLLGVAGSGSGSVSSLPAKPPTAMGGTRHANKKRRVEGGGGSHACVHGREGEREGGTFARAGEEDDAGGGGGGEDVEGTWDVEHGRDDGQGHELGHGHGHGEDRGQDARKSNMDALFMESFVRDPWKGLLPRRLPPLSSSSGSGSGSGYGPRR